MDEILNPLQSFTAVAIMIFVIVWWAIRQIRKTDIEKPQERSQCLAVLSGHACNLRHGHDGVHRSEEHFGVNGLQYIEWSWGDQ